jgi:Flp pilus assembly secretin CpaC
LLPATTLPCLIKSSMPLLETMSRSVSSPSAMRLTIRPEVSELTMSLCSVACSNSGLISIMAALIAPLISTRISAACAFVPTVTASMAVRMAVRLSMAFPPDSANYTPIPSGPQCLDPPIASFGGKR